MEINSFLDNKKYFLLLLLLFDVVDADDERTANISKQNSLTNLTKTNQTKNQPNCLWLNSECTLLFQKNEEEYNPVVCLVMMMMMLVLTINGWFFLAKVQTHTNQLVKKKKKQKQKKNDGKNI